MFADQGIKQLSMDLYGTMAYNFETFFRILGTIEKEWIWANSSIKEYNYYLEEIRVAHDEYMKKNPSRTFPVKEFYKRFPYPIHPQYAIEMINDKVNQVMQDAFGNTNNQTMLHCQIDCMRFARNRPKVAGYQNWFCCCLVRAGMDMYALDRRGKMAIEYAVGELGQQEKMLGVDDMQLELLLKAYLSRGFDIFKRPSPVSVSFWELLNGTGRITMPILKLLR